ncbi:unnamed protein product [Rhodiola kirilowii]
MYSRGSNGYGQQPYSGQSAYNQSLGSSYAGNSVGGPDSAARHLAMLGSSQDAEIGGYRSHASAAASYGGQYGSVYGSAGLSSSQQVSQMSLKGPGSASLEGRSSYASARQESPPKYTPGEYGSSTRGYGQKIDPLYSEKIKDYYGEQNAYMGRDLRSEPSGRYADSLGYGSQHQVEPHDRIDQASLLRREQLLKVQSLQSASVDNGARQVDYLASRGASIRHPTQDLMSYGGRTDPETRNVHLMSGSSFGSQQTPSILGAAPRRVADDIFPQGSSNPGYGVSLPPGRDYGSAKGLHAASLELDYPGGVMSRGAHSRLDDHKDDRAKYARQLESREEERRRERIRDRDREREREKERERERERERLRTLERREKERERERRLAVEVRRDRTPIRLSRDRRGPSLSVDARPTRKDSPRREASHRRHSPVKEKRREYVCKVHSYRVVDMERDYLSLDKRYPKLFVPPEFSKLIVYWPREDLKLSLHTAVSFEHDFADEDCANLLETPVNQIATGNSDAKPRDTVWIAKVLLMSGLSRSALEDLVSESDDRLVHICNILRFSILKRDRAFTAIGGPWDPTDGGDPSNDDSSLVQTALRYVKDTTQLDLQKCRTWNRFLEIHYDRVGNDGLFSHKEVTVLYVPDLSECVPSFDAWKNQWLEHRKAVAERERQNDLKKEKNKTKEEPRVEKAANNSAKKDGKKSESSRTEVKEGKKEDNNAVMVEKKENDSTSKEDKPEGDTLEQGKIDKNDVKEETSVVTATGTKIVKKKIIKKVVKKVADKGPSAVGNIVDNKQMENTCGKDGADDDNKRPEIGSPSTESPVMPSNTKTVIRKKIIKKVPVSKNTSNETNDLSAEVKMKEETAEESVAKVDDPVAISEGLPDKTEDSAADPAKEPVAKTSGTKTTTVKRKIIKKVPKKKTTSAEATAGTDSNKVAVKDKMIDIEESEKLSSNTENQATEANISETNKSSITSVSSGKKSTAPGATETKVANVKGEKSENGSKAGSDTAKGETKSIKEDKKKVGKDDVKSQSKEVIDKKKLEEPPRPGFILKTKSNKNTKVRSLSLSLESLLDYTDKDVDESTFEISVFAESVYEMLQYQMGSRILTFLQKLRIKFVSKRNQKKRGREETSVKEKETITPTKRLKKDDSKVKGSEDDSKVKDSVDDSKVKKDGADDSKVKDSENDLKAKDLSEKTVKMETEDNDNETNSPSADDGTKIMEEEEGLDLEPAESDEDPEEEDPEEEDEEMKDASSPVEENDKEKTEVADLPAEKVEEKEKTDTAKDSSDKAHPENNSNSGAEASKYKKAKIEDHKKRTPAQKEVVDKELLQAFRFFDRNRVGYVRVEDMRLIIHAMGKYLSHRDVKELVQSALLESNTGRDDHILYNKLVRMADI